VALTCVPSAAAWSGGQLTAWLAAHVGAWLAGQVGAWFAWLNDGGTSAGYDGVCVPVGQVGATGDGNVTGWLGCHVGGVSV
jgi:hypothetical protein